jgi:hypothetical protein
MRDVYFVHKGTDYTQGHVACTWMGQKPLTFEAISDALTFYGFQIKELQGVFWGEFMHDAGQQVCTVPGTAQPLRVSCTVHEFDPIEARTWLQLRLRDTHHIQATVWFNDVTDSYWLTPATKEAIRG